jgi:hypothetical protein
MLERLILGNIDGREKPHAVPHGDAVFVLGVVGFDVIQPLPEDQCFWANEQTQGDGEAVHAVSSRWECPTEHSNCLDSHSPSKRELSAKLSI